MTVCRSIIQTTTVVFFLLLLGLGLPYEVMEGRAGGDENGLLGFGLHLIGVRNYRIMMMMMIIFIIELMILVLWLGVLRVCCRSHSVHLACWSKASWSG
jgi:hypothetical protein